MKIFFLPILLIAFLYISCSSNEQKQPGIPKITSQLSPSVIMQANMEKLKDIIVYDVFSPPVASRIYAYTSLAQYESIRFSDTSFPSFLPKLQGFDAVPQPVSDLQYNFTVAAVKAFETMASKVIFNKDSLLGFTTKTLDDLSQGLNPSVYERSLQLGDSIGKIIWKRSLKDLYKETRGMERLVTAEA